MFQCTPLTWCAWVGVTVHPSSSRASSALDHIWRTEALALSLALSHHRCVEHDQAFSDEEKVKSGALKLSLFLNAAAVALKRKDWRKVRTD